MAELDATTEVWRPIPMTDGLYEASTLGNIRKTPAPLKAYLNHRRGGYAILTVKTSRGAVKATVHALVASAFIGPRPLGADVNHKNGKRADNRPENLEYATRGENLLHSYRFLGRSPSIRKKWAKLTPEQVHEILSLLADGSLNQSDIARRFGVHHSLVNHIARGRARTSVRARR